MVRYVRKTQFVLCVASRARPRDAREWRRHHMSSACLMLYRDLRVFFCS